MIWASACINSGVYIKTLCCAKSEKKEIAITFDDGPEPEITNQVLDILNKNGAKATFFLIGEKIEKNQETVKRIVDEGHIVGLHTYSHRFNFPISGYKSVKEELTRCIEAIEKVTNKRANLFRPPFGVTNPIIAKAVKILDLQCIGWSIRSLDTANEKEIERVTKRVIRKLHSGAIILLHDRLSNAPALLERIIIESKRKGYSIKPLDQVLKIKVYKNE